jgi:PAS domain S-box-containing protein
MTDTLVILGVTGSANLLLGLLVYTRDPKAESNRYFMLFSFLVAAWSISNGLVTRFAAEPSGVYWARAAFAAASLIPASFLLFVSAFPSRQHSPPATILVTAVGVAALVFGACLTPLVAVSTQSVDSSLRVVYGPAHPIFGIYFLVLLGYSLAVLARKGALLKGIQKLQVRYVFLGVLAAGTGATATNLLIPLFLGTSRFSRYGPVFSIVMMALIAHSIIRHRLMNIRLAIRSGVTYVASVVVVGFLFVFSASIVSVLLLGNRRDLPLALAVALAVIVALLFPPVKNWIQALIDSYVFREPYDYQRSVREIIRRLASTLDVTTLLESACDLIERTVHPEAIRVYAFDPVAETYECAVTRSSVLHGPTTSQSLGLSSPLVQLLADRQHAFQTHELRLDGQRALASAAARQLTELGAEVAVPIIHDRDLTGFLLLGPKRAGDPYFSEDLDLLSTLGSQAAMALRNAQLYSEVVLANEYVENILSNMDSGVIAISVDGGIRLSNAAAARLLDLDQSTIRSLTLTDLPNALQEPLRLTLRDAMSRSQIETTLLAHTGQLTPIICSTSPLRNRQGETIGAVVVFNDLTKAKRLEEEKRQADRLASIGALAAGIAHEIKNPLVAIKTFAELLPERFLDDEFRTDFARVVTTEITRIDGLVARLRGLATTGIRPLQSIDIRTPIEETLALLRAQIAQANITVATSWSPSLPRIQGDPGQLKQLFLNLFLNSLEAMPPGGRLSITVEPRTDRQYLIIDISDTGPGIPDTLIDKVFDPFVTTKPNGSGLGLSICRGIAERHRASIRAARNDAGGTSMVLEFPIANAPDVDALVNVAGNNV